MAKDRNKLYGREHFDWEFHKLKMDVARRKCNPGYSRCDMNEQDRDLEWKVYQMTKGTDE